MSSFNWPSEISFLGDQIVALTPPQAGELALYLERTHGIAAPEVIEVVDDEDDDVDDVVLTPLFDVRLDGFDSTRKVEIIKALRELRPLGVKQAKELAESCPVAIETGLDAAAAAPIKARLESAGARVSLIKSSVTP